MSKSEREREKGRGRVKKEIGRVKLWDGGGLGVGGPRKTKKKKNDFQEC